MRLLLRIGKPFSAVRIGRSELVIARPNSFPYLFLVSPDAATEMQIERYRQMTGEERVKLGFDLFRLACDVARAGIRSQHPGADEAEVERLLKERLALARNL